MPDFLWRMKTSRRREESQQQIEATCENNINFMNWVNFVIFIGVRSVIAADSWPILVSLDAPLHFPKPNNVFTYPKFEFVV